jgi:hypothetical protein
MVVLTLSLVAVAGTTVAWIVDQGRSRRRNAQDRCGACGVSWSEAPSMESYLIHGRLVCHECAARARRRMPWELGALAGWAAVVTTTVVGGALGGQSVPAAIFATATAAAAIVVPIGAVQLMKLQNRRAQRRISEGRPVGAEGVPRAVSR